MYIHTFSLLAGIFDLIDVNGNDDISKAEFLAAVKSDDEKINDFILESPWLYKLTQQNKLDEAFSTLDKDNGGHICFEEFWSFCHSHIINPGDSNDLTKPETNMEEAPGDSKRQPNEILPTQQTKERSKYRLLKKPSTNPKNYPLTHIPCCSTSIFTTE